MMIKKEPTTPRCRTLASTLLTAMLAAATSAYATSDTWLGSTDTLWATSSNWATSPATVPGTGDTATFNGTGNGNTTIDLGSGVTLGSLLFDTSSAAGYTIGSGGAGSQTLTFGSTLGNVITMNSTVAANQLVNSNLALSVSSTAATPATYYTVTNNSLTNTLTLAGGISASTAGVKTLNVTGSGNTAISGAITSGSGNVSIFKTGSGTLTLSGGATWSGAGITDASNFTTSAVFREGTTVLNGGTYGNSNGELVVGGVTTVGGAGADTTLQLNNGTTLNGISWLSIGRGNGSGTATSNLTLNGNATVTTTNLSAGFNAGNTGNKPKGTVTLNNTSTLTVTSTATGTSAGSATFNLGESANSDMTLTVNDTAVLNRTGGNTALAGNSQNQGAFQIGREGKGTVIMNGGTINVASTDLGRGFNASSAQNGTLTIKTGATYNNEGDFRMGFAGAGQAALNLQGGTLNIGTTTARTMVIGTFDTAQSTVTVDSGNLNLNTNSSIRFNAQGNTGAKVFNLNGGAVTSYSDNATTATGSGVLDMMQASSTASNTFNLNGGTLAIRQVLSTGTTGTRTFNFNGGTLKATGTTTAFFNLGTGGTTSANVRNGGAVINTNGFNVTVAQALVHSAIGGDNATDGGLTKTGAGTLTLSGANTYTGGTTVSAGTLALSSNFTMSGANQMTIAATGTAGTNYATLALTGSNTLNFGGTLAINFSSSILSGGETFNLFQPGSNGLFNSGFTGVSIAGSYVINALTGASGVWTGSASGFDFTFSESTGDLSVVASAVPEPATYAAILGSLALGAVALNRRRRTLNGS